MKLNERTVKYSLIQRIAEYPLILLNTKRVLSTIMRFLCLLIN